MQYPCCIDAESAHIRGDGEYVRNLCNDPRPFGVVAFYFCGNFRQILSVVPKGTRGQIVSAYLNVLHPGNTFDIYHSPLSSPQMSAQERLCQEFANRILAVGQGRDTNNEIIQWPLNRMISNYASQSLANAIYPTLTGPNVPLRTAQHLAECTILATRNDTIDNLNDQLLASINSEVFASYSADNVVDDGDAET